MTPDHFTDNLLLEVEKPSRYIGGEWNSVVKDPARVDLRLCLVFPDLYELGLGNLGLQILYTVLNEMEGVWAERAYLPGPDMAALMRARSRPLRMLESQESITEVHGIGFTLQSELTYVNVLKILELAALPLLSGDRDASMPLVFAGGPGAYNPEPLAPFMDFFVIGDGEEAIREIALSMQRHRGAPRRVVLEALSEIEGVYVPALYPIETLPDGRLLPDPSYGPIRARFVSDLDRAPFPVNYITPYTQLVHDGVGIEVLRGCTHGCRFCQAGMITRPVRERSIPGIRALLEGTLKSSGLEDATLLSLSTCDYSRVWDLLQDAAQAAAAHKAALALPSLRLDRFSVALADFVTSMRRSGLTFAPEAGTARLRAVINKSVSDEQLLELAEEAFRRGWTHIKLYFMIGLPTETEEDVAAIADLCVRTLHAGRKVQSRAELRTGVSTFVPKPFTPFQWAGQIGLAETIAKQQHLSQLLRPHRRIKFGRHAPESSFIEGLLSRADRRAAPLLLSVLRHGGGYETWEEHLNFTAWQAALEETHYPVEAVFSERGENERFPWDFIDAQVGRDALLEEWLRSKDGTYTADCRTGTCNLCGAQRHAAALCDAMRKRGTASPKETPAPAKRSGERLQGKLPAIQRLRLQVGRTGRLRFLSHLETVQAWIRALRRASIPLAYSQGFHAHPKITFSTALPLGEESKAEWMDLVLEESRAPEELLAALRSTLPEGLHAYNCREVPLNASSLMAAVDGFSYLLLFDPALEDLEERTARINSATSLLIERMVKSRSSGGGDGRKPISLDIRPLITEIAVFPVPDGYGETGCVRFSTRLLENRLAKPREIVALLGLDPLQTRVIKVETHLAAPES